MTNIGGCEVIKEPINIVINLDFDVVFTLVLTLDKNFLQVFWEERLNKGRHLLFLRRILVKFK